MHQLLQLLRKPLQQLRKKLRHLLKAKQHPSPVTRGRSKLDWVIPGKLAVGGLPQPGDSKILARSGIKVVFSLCSGQEGKLPPDVLQKFYCLRLSLPDSRYATQLHSVQIAKAVGVIHKSLHKQWPIYVHCLAGIERSPTVCTAYLCRYYKLEIWEAISELKRVRPESMPTEMQIRVLQEFLNGKAR